MRLMVAADAEAAAHLAASEMTRACAAALDSRGRAVIAVSGGESPWVMLRKFAQAELPWHSVYIAQVDERCVPFGDARRNLARLHEILVSDGPLPAANLLPMPAESAELDAASQAYSALLADHAGSPAVMDLVQLGLGVDGHTASLVPNDPALEVANRNVAVTAPYQGSRRMTLTYAVLSGARERLWLVTGAAKAAALSGLLKGIGNLPASRVSRTNATVVADRAAAPSPASRESRSS